MNIPQHLIDITQRECQNLLANQKGVSTVVIASLDGFDVSSASSSALDPARIAAMASSIAAIGSVVTQETSLGNSKSVTVNTEDGFVYITYIDLDSTNYILSTVADNSAVLAQIIYQCGEIRKRLKNI